MALHVACTLPEFDDCWLDVAEMWTRREWKNFISGNNEAFWYIWHAKVLACHLRANDGALLVQPGEIDEETLDSLDLRLVGFVVGAPGEACAHLRGLGNASGRILSPGTGA